MIYVPWDGFSFVFYNIYVNDTIRMWQIYGILGEIFLKYPYYEYIVKRYLVISD